MEARVRRAEAKDIPTIMSLEYENFDEPWSYETILLEMAKGTNITLVIENQKVFGYMLVIMMYEEFHIGSICIDENYRNLGYGEMLLKSFFDITDSFGYDTTLEVRYDNYSAIKLYEKLGFEKSGIRKNYYKHGKDAIIMWRKNVNTGN